MYGSAPMAAAASDAVMPHLRRSSHSGVSGSAMKIGAVIGSPVLIDLRVQSARPHGTADLYRERLNAVLAVDELWCEARRMLRVAQLSWRLPRKFLMAENRFPQRLEHLVPVPLP